jgi:hypothetical protein
VVLVRCVGDAGARQRGHLAASHGDDRARVERGLRLRLIAPVLERTLVQVAAPAQPSARASPRTLDDAAELRSCRRRRRIKAHEALRVASEDAIENQDIEVHVEIQTAEALNADHRAAAPSIPLRLAHAR